MASPPSKYLYRRGASIGFDEVIRPRDGWVSPLEALEQMERADPRHLASHEKQCLSLYRDGNSREEVFEEMLSLQRRGERNAKIEWKEHADQYEEGEEEEEYESLAISVGLSPGPNEPEKNQKLSAGGFERLQGTSQGSRFDVPPEKWIEEELVKFGARSKFFCLSQRCIVPRE
jgi:hypothetical protein